MRECGEPTANPPHPTRALSLILVLPSLLLLLVLTSSCTRVLRTSVGRERALFEIPSDRVLAASAHTSVCGRSPTWRKQRASIVARRICPNSTADVSRELVSSDSVNRVESVKRREERSKSVPRRFLSFCQAKSAGSLNFCSVPVNPLSGKERRAIPNGRAGSTLKWLHTVSSVRMKTSHMHLSRDREQTVKMHHRAVHQINQALDVCLNSTRSKEQWACLRRGKHLEMYAKKQATSMASVFLLGVNEAKCGFDEVYDLLSFDSTDKFRLMMALIHGKDCKDAGLISMRPKSDHLSEWSLNTQHSAIWFALQNRRKAALVREKSFTFFQTLKIILPELRPSGMSAMNGGAGHQSEGVMKRTMALSWLPFPETDTFDFDDDTREAINLQYTLIIEELGRDRLRVSCVTSSFHDGNAPNSASRWTARAVARRLVFRSISRLEAAVIASRISDQEFLMQHQWVKNEERAACVICWKQFNALFRRRHHCRLCGEVICGSCSSLRRTNVVMKKELQKVRVCHLCSNKGRVKADSFASTTDTFPGHHTTDEEMPMAKLFPGAGGSFGPRMHRDNKPRFEIEKNGSDDDEDDDDDDDEDDYEEDYDGYIGHGPDSVMGVYSSSQKVISIKSLNRSDLKVRSMNVNPHHVDVKKAAPKKANSGGDESQKRTQRAEQNDQVRYSVSFLHPAARTPNNARALQPVVADYGSYEEYALTTRDSDFSNRRTSIASSNFGLLDRYYVDDGYFLPKLDPARELQRLKLMKVVCSPACTLIEPMLMKKCCEVAASAFGVSGAFIARVEEHHVSIEHAVGVPRFFTYDQFFRHETLCDFVLVQPQHHPLVILDCMVDPRTREIPMVQQLEMRFFVGVSIFVRGLPIGCLCAFDQGNSDDPLVTTRYDLSILENAVRSIESELEKLVQGLDIS